MVSAQSLPGDGLYVMKLSLESADGFYYGDVEWREIEQQRRLSEVLTLAAADERATVSFIAAPTREDNGSWTIGTVPLVVSEDQGTMLANQCPQQSGAVRIHGEVYGGQIYANAITPTCFYIAGIPG